MNKVLISSLLLLAIVGVNGTSNSLEQTQSYTFNWTPVICTVAPFGVIITALGGLVEYLWIKFAQLVWDINFERGDMTGFKVYGVGIAIVDLIFGIFSFWGVFHCTSQIIQVAQAS